MDKLTIFMKTLFITFILGTILMCNTKLSNKKTEFETRELPEIKAAYSDCIIKYRSDLYESKQVVNFEVNIVHITGSLVDKFTLSTALEDSTIMNDINMAYYKAGFSFKLHNSSVSSEELYIDDFSKHCPKYRSKPSYFAEDEGLPLTILVYHLSKNDSMSYANGVAEAAPSRIMGIMSNRIGSTTVVHEMGHMLGLGHIFTKDDSNGNNAMYGDLICDTPAYNIMDNNKYVIGCTWEGPPKYTEDELKILIPNYLNYNSQLEDCRNLFTPVQILAMRWYVENTPFLTEATDIYN